MQLYGRNEAIKLVHEFSVRDGSAPRPAPVLIMVGHRGSGKSSLLDLLAHYLNQNVPYGRVDFRSAGDRSVAEVLGLLVQGLNTHCAAYGRIVFPRFIVGNIVQQATINHTNPASARAQIKNLLAQHQRVDALQGSIATMVRAFSPGIDGAALTRAIDLLIKSVTRWRIGGRVILGKGATWYAHQDRGLSCDYLDVLRLLNHQAKGNDTDRKKADDLLLRAFLADLRADHDRWFRRRRDVNCVILLDDVDEPSGRGFLDALREIHGTENGREIGHITVVATSRGPFVEPYASPGEAFPTTDRASVNDHLRRRLWCYPVRIPDLTVDQVRAMVEEKGLRDREKVARAVYRFTKGHAGATFEVVSAIKEAQDSAHEAGRARPRAPVTLPQVLKVRRPGGPPGRTVAERLGDMFLDGLPAQVRDDLITCAAARDHGEAGELVGRGGPIGDDAARVLGETTIWLPGSTTDAPTMHPVLRRLLLDRLAGRPPRAANGWTTVHKLLRRRAEEAKDEAGELYHTLALGETKEREMQEVADELTRRLRDPAVSAASWLALLDQVATAPHRDLFTQASADHANELARRVTHADSLTQAVARLLAAQWVANEPLADGDRSALLACIDAAFTTVAIECPKTGAMYRAKGAFLRRVTGGEGRLGHGDGGTNPWSPPRSRRKQIAAALVVLLAGASMGVGWGLMAWSDSRCAPGIRKVTVHVGGGRTRVECVGVTDSFPFEPRLRHIVDALARENAYATEGGPGGYVTIAFAGPLTNPDPRVVHQLEGAVAGQHRSNREALVGNRPRIRLVLANMDSTEGHWREVADELAAMVDGPDRLVAVAGLGLSQVETKSAAERLRQAELPMVVDIVTSEEIDKTVVHGLARVNPTTEEEMAVLGRYVREKGRLRSAMMVSYSQGNDLYAKSLVAMLGRHFRDLWERGGRINNPFGEDPDNEFRVIVGNLCSENAPDTILYAGRGKDLPRFLAYLGNRHCHPKRITVLTGSDAVRLLTDHQENAEGVAALRSSHNPVSLVYVPLAEPSVLRDGARNPAAPQYLKFERSFRDLGFAPADLSTGWAIMAHDAVLTAAHAIRRAAPGGGPPSPAAVRNQLYLISSAANSVPGASGQIRIDSTTGNRTSQLLPVLRLRPGEEPDLLGLYHTGAGR